ATSSSPFSTSPFGMVQCPRSLSTQCGPPWWASSTSRRSSRRRHSRMPALVRPDLSVVTATSWAVCVRMAACMRPKVTIPPREAVHWGPSPGCMGVLPTSTTSAGLSRERGEGLRDRRAGRAMTWSDGGHLDPQLLPDGRLDLFHRAGRIHRHNDLLGAEQVQDRPGLVVVVPQTTLDRLRGVVGPGHQLAAAHIPHARCGWPVEDEVVVDPALRAQAPAEDAVSDQLVGDLEQDDRVQVVALQEEAGLGLVAGEAVDEQAVVPVVLAQAPVDHGLDQVVGDQLTGGHAASDLGAELGVVLDVPAEDVADADVLQIEAFGQELGLGAFPAALDAHDDVLAHPSHLPSCVGVGRRVPGLFQPRRGPAVAAPAPPASELTGVTARSLIPGWTLLALVGRSLGLLDLCMRRMAALPANSVMTYGGCRRGLDHPALGVAHLRGGPAGRREGLRDADPDPGRGQ